MWNIHPFEKPRGAVLLCQAAECWTWRVWSPHWCRGWWAEETRSWPDQREFPDPNEGNVVKTTRNHPFGSGLNPTHKNGDDWGMVYYCFNRIALVP